MPPGSGVSQVGTPKKHRILEHLDEAFRVSSPAALQQVLRQLESSAPSRKRLWQLATEYNVARDNEERDHLLNDWFGVTENGGRYWQKEHLQPVADKVRQGLIATINEALISRLPVSTSWAEVPKGHDFAVTVQRGEQQISMIIVAPEVPPPARARRRAEKELAKKRASAKKKR